MLLADSDTITRNKITTGNRFTEFINHPLQRQEETDHILSFPARPPSRAAEHKRAGIEKHPEQLIQPSTLATYFKGS
ncbi:hypothetical protein E2C01_013645 [Portunus trituberculatus]|uniref:Uncharacterized protein n=1 Tax=Portunus trituberculatus TaxID=210409 RepID=A0A5B7DGT4_PORTR|nr:hypothetical protein [Portunus trituberculatus]